MTSFPTFEAWERQQAVASNSRAARGKGRAYRPVVLSHDGVTSVMFSGNAVRMFAAFASKSRSYGLPEECLRTRVAWADGSLVLQWIATHVGALPADPPSILCSAGIVGVSLQGAQRLGDAFLWQALSLTLGASHPDWLSVDIDQDLNCQVRHMRKDGECVWCTSLRRRADGAHVLQADWDSDPAKARQGPSFPGWSLVDIDADEDPDPYLAESFRGILPSLRGSEGWQVRVITAAPADALLSEGDGRAECVSHDRSGREYWYGLTWYCDGFTDLLPGGA